MIRRFAAPVPPWYGGAMAAPSSPRRSLGMLIDAVRARIGLLRKASTFAAIGVINTLVDFGVFLACWKLLGLPLVPANLVAWMIAVSGSYVLNSFITFAAESGRKLTLRSYAAFVVSGVAGFLGNTAVLWAASWFVPVPLAKVCAIGASFVINFSLSHFVVFRRRPTDNAGETTAGGPVA
jgi:putative flippase GtrA